MSDHPPTRIGLVVRIRIRNDIERLNLLAAVTLKSKLSNRIHRCFCNAPILRL